ncbi:hypothetical protein [Sphingobacterium composti Ten et al. 2007 non Yoo et al. 2007]|uniref:hypothetical protein n=1 Tax=Sphingobacterium composti TaxID=363260 RepID=UPI0013586CB5|nr:hypothetical protein [Sphingobacterium composti Ten et al. 2007 non Yoo et al. 2007]
MSNKDLIEDIKAKLKEKQEIPYREGAWEKYAAHYGTAPATKVISFKRMASIAAAGLLMLGASLYLYQSQQSTLIPSVQTELVSSIPDHKESPLDVQSHTNIEVAASEEAIKSNNPIASISRINTSTEKMLEDISTVAGIQESDLIDNKSMLTNIVSLNTIKPVISGYKHNITSEITPVQIKPSITTLAHRTANADMNRNVDNLPKSSLMSLGEKFQLGLFVSPQRTADKFDVGAGFLVSYALTPKISIRTGTSYNSYTVGVVKDPLEMANAEMISMDNVYQNSPLAGELNFAAKQQMILPNVNAVMGKVEALEIPLDIKYNFNKGFYSSAGISYSAIINQQREAQYIENVGAFSLQDKATLIPNAAQDLNKPQVKTVKSLQENVNPNGFNGFANFSIGKKVNMNNKMSLSVEPFVKVPLGQFRKSDLDYTNSGIRIITSF